MCTLRRQRIDDGRPAAAMDAPDQNDVDTTFGTMRLPLLLALILVEDLGARTPPCLALDQKLLSSGSARLRACRARYWSRQVLRIVARCALLRYGSRDLLQTAMRPQRSFPRLDRPLRRHARLSRRLLSTCFSHRLTGAVAAQRTSWPTRMRPPRGDCHENPTKLCPASPPSSFQVKCRIPCERDGIGEKRQCPVNLRSKAIKTPRP